VGALTDPLHGLSGTEFCLDERLFVEVVIAKFVLVVEDNRRLQFL
jgi:hypothetical protein